MVNVYIPSFLFAPLVFPIVHLHSRPVPCVHWVAGRSTSSLKGVLPEWSQCVCPGHLLYPVIHLLFWSVPSIYCIAGRNRSPLNGLLPEWLVCVYSSLPLFLHSICLPLFFPLLYRACSPLPRFPLGLIKQKQTPRVDLCVGSVINA